MRRRVVVTGIGCISPLGHDVKTTWEALVRCESGIRHIENFDVSDMNVKIAGTILRGDGRFDPDAVLSPSDQRKIDLFIIYAICAADQAFKDAGFDFLSDEQKAKTATIIGSGIGGVSRLYDTSVTLFEEGARRVSPFFIPSVLVNLAPGHVAMRCKFRGPNYGVVSACASGTHSIGEAFKLIQSGGADFALAGGAEAAVCKLGVAGFASARALSTHYNDSPQSASRPWDKDRDGFVVGEGAGILALETLESAKKRGAKIYGEIVGYGASCDAYHITAPDPESKGAILSMQNALENAQIAKENISYINAHGTSTPAGDIAELNAVKKVFGSHAYELNVSSTKSAMGHLLGAAGAVESVICLMAMQNSVVPATLNLENPDESCDLNLTPKVPQERKLEYVMNNSFGFGGTNASLILKKV